MIAWLFLRLLRRALRGRALVVIIPVAPEMAHRPMWQLFGPSHATLMRAVAEARQAASL